MFIKIATIDLVKEPAGYDRHRQTPLFLPTDSVKKTGDAITQAGRDFTTLFNITSAYFFLSKIAGTKTLKADKLKDVYSSAARNIIRNTPLSKRAVKESISMVNRTFKQKKNLIESGQELLPVYPFSGASTICLPMSATRIVKVRTMPCICCDLFNSSWADNNHLTPWILFPISSVLSHDTTNDCFLAGMELSKISNLVERYHVRDGVSLHVEIHTSKNGPHYRAIVVSRASTATDTDLPLGLAQREQRADVDMESLTASASNG